MRVLFILLCVGCVACTTTKQTMDSWLGADKSDLILKWGPPDRVASDGQRGEILIYGKPQYNPYNGQQFYRTTMFYVNPNQLIYHYLWNTQYVPPQQLDMNVYVR